MSKVLVGIFLGVFVGALAYELLNRVNPEFVKKVESKTSEKMDELLQLKSVEAHAHPDEAV